MRKTLIGTCMLLCSLGTPAFAQLSINFGGPGIRIGIDLPVYPTLQRIPGYPVYYAPGVGSNYFFYDGLYWVFDGEDWYASSWYNGPWHLVDRYEVPVYVLRVPVRYYRHAPAYFKSWRADAPPRWGERWGGSWEQRRSGWDRWNRSSAPAPAPLPTYQRQYSGDRYPRAVEQQQSLVGQRYRYQPRDTVVRQYYQEHVQRAPVTTQRQEAPRERRQQEVQQQRAPQETTRRQQEFQRSSPPAPQPQAPAQAPAQ